MSSYLVDASISILDVISTRADLRNLSRFHHYDKILSWDLFRPFWCHSSLFYIDLEYSISRFRGKSLCVSFSIL